MTKEPPTTAGPMELAGIIDDVEQAGYWWEIKRRKNSAWRGPHGELICEDVPLLPGPERYRHALYVALVGRHDAQNRRAAGRGEADTHSEALTRALEMARELEGL